MPDSAEPLTDVPIVPPLTPSRRRAWRWALVLAFAMLAGLAWLLAVLIWLPMYFGLFFFLVAGLLVSAIAFRLARGARPLASGMILRGAAIVSVLAIAVTLVFEYRQFVDGIADPPHFTDARNAAVLAGRTAKEIKVRAGREFKSALASKYPPGGVLGYALWSVRSGEMTLTVDGESDKIASPHRGVAWPLRTLAAAVLLAAGLWLGLESLRSPTPTSNVLAPGEEPAEEEA